MLESLELNCFRQFESKTVNFHAGNTAIRGRNEGGKTTLLEAFFYAIGGSRCTRNSDFVTWGAKPASCKVVATLRLGGAKVVVTRSPKGAEIYLNDEPTPTVTGQNEVTAFMQAQFSDVPMELASRMMFVEQGEIRGMLELRPGEKGGAVDTIEKLAGLDIIDYFITEIQATGKVGDTTMLDLKLASEKQELDDISAASFDEGIAKLTEQVASWEHEMDGANKAVNAAEAALDTLNDKLVGQQGAKRALEAAQERLARAKLQVELQQTELTAMASALSQFPPASDLQGDLDRLTAELVDAHSLEQRVIAFQQFKAYVEPGTVWEGTLDSLNGYLADLNDQRDEAQRQANKAEADSRVLQAQKITETVCGLCGKDVSAIPEVASKNAEIDTKIAALQAEYEAAKARWTQLSADIQVAQAVRSLPAPRLNPNYVELVDSHWPPVPSWIGGDTPDSVDLSAQREQRDAVKAQLAERRAAEAKLTTAQARLDAAVAQQLQAAEEVIAAEGRCSDLDLEGLPEMVAAKRADLQALRQHRSECASKSGECQANLTSLKASRDLHTKKLARLQESIDILQRETADYQYNNDLIAALRAARPLVANQLWSMVLKAVSTFLSKMRSEASIVERVEKTFTVNGHPFTSLSGSAMDLLGLAIRMALVKVFVPGNDMLLLDEPFAACDASRTQQCLAFTALAGFKQVIVITHEGDTEQVFDHLVTV